MEWKETIKRIGFINEIGKKVNIYKEFLTDARSFSKYYMLSAEKHGDYRYGIMLIVHSLEKGICMPSPRPFGRKKVLELISLLQKPHVEKYGYEYDIGMSALSSWRDFYKENGWEEERGYEEVSSFIEGKGKPVYDTGRKLYCPAINIIDVENANLILQSRHSVRNFSEKKIRREDIEYAVKCFQQAPTACNRQMCKLYYIENKAVKGALDNSIIGISGFNKETVHYFVVTYDLSAFAYSGERQQGLLNAGLCTMNFMNGLHVKGIGSCCLQWSNKNSEDLKIRTMLKMDSGERIAVIIGAGYYVESNEIPCSVRKNLRDILKIV